MMAAAVRMGSVEHDFLRRIRLSTLHARATTRSAGNQERTHGRTDEGDKMERTPYQKLLWTTTRLASRNFHSTDASLMVTMIGEIDLDRYAGLPVLRSQLQDTYRERVGVPPKNRAEDAAMVLPKAKRGPNPHPSRSRNPRDL
jgi:hypothetical protein